MNSPIFFSKFTEKIRRLLQKSITTKLVTAPLYAVRGWNLSGEGEWPYVLRGVRAKWPKGSLIATCPYSNHDVPDFECSCGMYCFKDGRDWQDREFFDFSVWGIIEISGKAIEHERGYRVGQATVVAIFYNRESYRFPRLMDPSYRERFPELDFDVPVFSSFTHMCQEYGLRCD